MVQLRQIFAFNNFVYLLASFSFQFEQTECILESAINGDFLKVVAFIEGKKENINLANEKGETALFLSSQKRFNKIVQYLLNKKANIEAKDKEGDTAFILGLFIQVFIL